nr:formimidoylglutamate deiminase-like [Nerophis lumbriciformis]
MRTLYFDDLFTGSEWLRAVRVEIDEIGSVVTVTGDAEPSGCEHLAGCVVPGMPNLHSHAHQRAMAGLAERSGPGEDSFWTWRELMYRNVLRIRPEQLEAIAAQLYVELLEAGYTAVGEFQYLHHDSAGRPYAEPAEMSLRCLSAARDMGIGLTLLPVLYQDGGFGGRPSGDGQRRFLNDAEGFLGIVGRLQQETDQQTAVGIAPHSLRAVGEELLGEVLAAWGERGPIHIHVAEQLPEVEDCLAWSGQRPVEWLFDRAAVDELWCLIHATHLDDDELSRLAASGAVVGLCPTTEANLGDGLFRAVEYLRVGGRLGIGSDSHISTSPAEELRWLEYGQRLRHHGRNLLTGGRDRSTGRSLYQQALAGGAQACGRPIGRIAPGCRADLVVLDTDHPLLAGRRGDAWLDSWIFAGNQVRSVRS